MKLRLLLYGVCFLFIITACRKDYVLPEGLALGMSFETTDDVFSYAPPSEQFFLSWTDEEAYDGNYCLKMQSNSTSNQGFAFWQIQFFDFEPGQTVKIRCRAKALGLIGEGFQINMFARGKTEFSTDTYGIGVEKTDTDDDWELIELSLNNPLTEEIAHVDIYMLLLKETIGTVYFDKLEIIVE